MATPLGETMTRIRRGGPRRLEPAAVVLGVMSAMLGADALLLAASASRGGNESEPTASATSTTTEAAGPVETETTVTTAQAPVASQEAPPSETPPVPTEAEPTEPPAQAFGQTVEPASGAGTPGPAPATATGLVRGKAAPPGRVLLARTGDDAKPLTALAGVALALGGAAIASSAGLRRRA